MIRKNNENYENLVALVTDWIIREGTTKTFSGNYSVYGSEIADYLVSLGLSFRAAFDWLERHKKNLKDSIDAREEIIGDTWYIHNEHATEHMSIEDKLKLKDVIGYDMIFGLAYCPNAS
ncbi:MAG: hypothetical protein IK121_03170 [Lachnospiraceae bacterium]|nr:hypothetical protein [Lachnospiraceae bacterium]